MTKLEPGELIIVAAGAYFTASSWPKDSSKVVGFKEPQAAIVVDRLEAIGTCCYRIFVAGATIAIAHSEICGYVKRVNDET